MSTSIPRNAPQQLEKRDLSASFQLKPFGLFFLWLGGNHIFQLGLLTLMLPIIVIPFQRNELLITPRGSLFVFWKPCTRAHHFQRFRVIVGMSFFGPKVSWILGLRSLLINQLKEILCRTDFLESPSFLYP